MTPCRIAAIGDAMRRFDLLLFASMYYISVGLVLSCIGGILLAFSATVNRFATQGCFPLGMSPTLGFLHAECCSNVVSM